MSALLRHRLQFNTGEFVNNHRQRLGLRHASSEESSSTSSTTPDDPSTPSSSTSPSGTNNNNKESSTSSSDNAELERRPNKNRPQKQQKGIQAWFSNLFSSKSNTSSSSTPQTKQSPIRFIINILALFLIMRFWPIPAARNPAFGGQEAIRVHVAFSDFVKQLKRNEVGRVVIDGTTFSFTLKPNSEMYKLLPDSLEKGRIGFQTVRPGDYQTPYELMLTNNVQFSAVEKGPGAFSTFLTFGVLFGVVLAVLNRLPLRLPNRSSGRKSNGGGSGGSSSTSSNIVKFADVAGVDEAKEELEEIVQYLRDPEQFSKLGARPPSGVLLVGPPGTGKTLLAKAVAGEADAPFFSISASEFIELYVGMGAMRVRELFAQARKEAPAIVFIDEIDAVAKGRDTKLRSVGNDEREQTLNQLLTELDGFDSNKDQLVICIAATNRPDVLDPALLRPGRFDRRVVVERPDKQGREEILRVHIGHRQLPLDEDVSVTALASQTTGFTGADLANLVNEAALLAGRLGKNKVQAADFDSAILRAVAGIEKKRSVLRGVEKQVVARHEVGHALVSTAVAALIPGAATVEKLSIIPRSGGALGFTYLPPKEEDRALMFDTEIRGQLAMLMGGRAAEALTCDAVSTGASDDIRRATDLAHKAVTQFGLSESIGPLNVDVLEGGGDDYAFLRDGAGTMARLVEREVKNLCDAALAVAGDVVTSNKKLHESMSFELEMNEKLESEVLKGMLGEVVVPESLKAFVLKGDLPSRVLKTSISSSDGGDGGGGSSNNKSTFGGFFGDRRKN